MTTAQSVQLQPLLLSLGCTGDVNKFACSKHRQTVLIDAKARAAKHIDSKEEKTSGPQLCEGVGSEEL